MEFICSMASRKKKTKKKQAYTRQWNRVQRELKKCECKWPSRASSADNTEEDNCSAAAAADLKMINVPMEEPTSEMSGTGCEEENS